MLQFKRNIFVAHRADQRTVRGAVLLHEHVEAHHALATYRNPQVGGLCRIQVRPAPWVWPGLYTERMHRVASSAPPAILSRSTTHPPLPVPANGGPGLTLRVAIDAETGSSQVLP